MAELRSRRLQQTTVFPTHGESTVVPLAPERARKEIPATSTDLLPTATLSRPKRQASRLLNSRKGLRTPGEEHQEPAKILHQQPGFSISKENHKITAQLNLTEMESNKPKSASRTKMLEEEINRLGLMLKAEQDAHQQTKINAQAELDRYREQLQEEKDMTVKGVIDEYMKLNLEQRDALNREQMKMNRDSSSEIKRLENELKDTQVAFDIFQANCREDFERQLDQTRDEMAKQRQQEIKEHDDRALARMKSRLAEQRKELEDDFNDTLLRVEIKQKHEIESLMAKLNNTNEDLAQMRETEAKAANLTNRLERQTQRIADLEKQNKEYEKKTNQLKIKVHEWENKSKNLINMAVAKTSAENERLTSEVAQLRIRLVSKAETIGTMQYNNSTRMQMLTSDVTCQRAQRPKLETAGTRRKTELKGLLNIKQIDDSN